MDYSKEIQNCLDNNIIGTEDIFDFQGSPLEELLNNYYAFCRENMNIASEQVNISPNFFFFNNSLEVNAGAGVRNKNFIISINLGLLKFCFNNYQMNDNLRIYFSERYPSTFEKFDNPVNILAFQVCTQFTYYHELAHLFQLSEGNQEITINERYDEETNDDFDLIRHILEANADIYASISIASHIEQYIEKTFMANVTEEDVTNTLVFFCCCLFNYILGFSDNVGIIYFEKYKHPHAFVRLLNVILNIVNHIEQGTNIKQQAIEIDGRKVFKTVVDVYRDLEKDGIFEPKLSNVVDNNKGALEKIIAYVSLLNYFNTTEYVDAMDVWNKSAK